MQVEDHTDDLVLVQEQAAQAKNKLQKERRDYQCTVKSKCTSWLRDLNFTSQCKVICAYVIVMTAICSIVLLLLRELVPCPLWLACACNVDGQGRDPIQVHVMTRSHHCECSLQTVHV